MIEYIWHSHCKTCKADYTQQTPPKLCYNSIKQNIIAMNGMILKSKGVFMFEVFLGWILCVAWILLFQYIYTDQAAMGERGDLDVMKR